MNVTGTKLSESLGHVMKLIGFQAVPVAPLAAGGGAEGAL